MTRRSSVISLDPATVRRARTLARRAGRPVVRLATAHTYNDPPADPNEPTTTT